MAGCAVEYVRLADAVEALAVRQADQALRQRVRDAIRQGMVLARAEELRQSVEGAGKSRDYLEALAAEQLYGQMIGEQVVPFPTGMVGTIGRHVATGRFEDVHFVDRCQRAGLKPWCLEYQQDRFCTVNPSKVRMWRLYALDGFGRQGGPRIYRGDIIRREQDWVHRPLADVKTFWGESLVGFHQRIRQRLGWDNGAIDTSAWLKSVGGQAEKYYRYYFLLAVTEMVLFESFGSTDFHGLGQFNGHVVNPALRWLADQGFPKPLIVLHPEDPEDMLTVHGHRLTDTQVLTWYPADPFRQLTDHQGQPLDIFPRLP